MSRCKKDNENLENKDNVNEPMDNKDQPRTGSHTMHLDSKIEDTATDVYYKTECKTEGDNVSIPTEDAVEEAKKWVDDEHEM